METVGQRIKALRRVTKTSQKELGKFCGVSDVAVGYWEKDVNIPNGESLVKLAKFFNTSIDYILYGTEFEGALITKMRRVPVISWVQAGQFTECKLLIYSVMSINGLKHHFALGIARSL
ncbi:Repressor protein C2 [Escherichia coli]|nr:Repressor protein C2 [Escherichia coli]